MAKYKVAEKFVSINGEGTKAGQLAVFIRFQGCNLKCAYCDTSWANRADAPFFHLDETEIYDYIKETGIENVTLTGGEPLLQKNIKILLNKLTADEGLRVEIETNGSLSLQPYMDMQVKPSFTMDYKLPGSCMEQYMSADNFSYLTSEDTVKFVVGDLRDLNKTKSIIERYKLNEICNVYISPVFGEINGEEIVQYLITNKLNRVKLQLQMHKIIWEANKRGV